MTDTVRHEARHAAMALTLGVPVSRATAVPNADASGSVTFKDWPQGEDEWERFALVALGGKLRDDGWPPARPSRQGATRDERQTAAIVERLGLDWDELCQKAERLASSPRFRRYEQAIGEWLQRGVALSASALEDLKSLADEDEENMDTDCERDDDGVITEPEVERVIAQVHSTDNGGASNAKTLRHLTKTFSAPAGWRVEETRRGSVAATAERRPVTSAAPVTVSSFDA